MDLHQPHPMIPVLTERAARYRPQDERASRKKERLVDVVTETVLKTPKKYHRTLETRIKCLDECIQALKEDRDSEPPRNKIGLGRTNAESSTAQKIREWLSATWSLVSFELRKSTKRKSFIKAQQICLQLEEAKDRLCSIHKGAFWESIPSPIIQQTEDIRSKRSAVRALQRYPAMEMGWINTESVRLTEILSRALDDCEKLEQETRMNKVRSPCSSCRAPVCTKDYIMQHKEEVLRFWGKIVEIESLAEETVVQSVVTRKLNALPSMRRG